MLFLALHEIIHILKSQNNSFLGEYTKNEGLDKLYVTLSEGCTSSYSSEVINNTKTTNILGGKAKNNYINVK